MVLLIWQPAFNQKTIMMSLWFFTILKECTKTLKNSKRHHKTTDHIILQIYQNCNQNQNQAPVFTTEVKMIWKCFS